MLQALHGDQETAANFLVLLAVALQQVPPQP